MDERILQLLAYYEFYYESYTACDRRWCYCVN